MPSSGRRSGLVVVALRDSRLKRELVGALVARDMRVERIDGLGALGARLIAAPVLAPLPDVVVWEHELAPLLELDGIWRRYGEGRAPRFVLVQKKGGLFAGNVETCRPRCDALLKAVGRAMRKARRTRLATAGCVW
jgi:hypothetical protein